MEIKEALSQMDVLDDDQWTQGGDPLISHVSTLVGRDVTRKEIIDAAPKFSKTNFVLDLESKEPEIIVEERETSDGSALEAFSVARSIQPSKFGAVLEAMPVEDLPEVETILLKQMETILKQERALEELKRITKMNLSTTRLWIKTLLPDVYNQQAIQDYIKSSTAERQRKAGAVAAVLGQMKVEDIKALDPRAPIDKAFARKTGRGAARPVR